MLAHCPRYHGLLPDARALAPKWMGPLSQGLLRELPKTLWITQIFNGVDNMSMSIGSTAFHPQRPKPQALRSGASLQLRAAQRAGRAPLAALRGTELLRRQRHLRERRALRAAGLHHVRHPGAALLGVRLPAAWSRLIQRASELGRRL